MKFVEKENININNKYHGKTPLLLATIANQTEIASILIQNKANVNATCDTKSVLCYAAEQGNFDLVVLLIEAQANIFHKTSSGENAIYLAKTHKKIVGYLLDRGLSSRCNVNDKVYLITDLETNSTL